MSNLEVAAASPLAGVYLVRGRATRLIKIGQTDCMAARLAGLQHHCADRLDLLAILPSDTPLRTEQSLHWQFNKLRRHGEWFAQGKALVAYLDSLRDPPDPDHDPDPFEIIRRDAWVYDRLSLYEMNGGKRGRSSRSDLEVALWAGRFVPAKLESPAPVHVSAYTQWRADYRAMMAANPMTNEAKMALAESVDASRLAPSMKRDGLAE